MISNLITRSGRCLRGLHFRTQLALVAGIAIFLLAWVSSMLNTWAASERTNGYRVQQGLQVAEGLARQSTLALLYHAPQNAEDDVAATLAFPDVRYVEIVDAAGDTLMARSSRTAYAYAPPPHHKDGVVADRAAVAWENGSEWGFSAPVFTGIEVPSPFEMQERKPVRLGYVVVVMSKEGVQGLVGSLQRVNLWVALSFAVLLFGLLGITVERLVRPLSTLSGLMRRAQTGEAGLRAHVTGSRDITDMAAAFNRMMSVLEEREAELQHSRDRALHTAQMKTQFAATVSHEVRTPLNGVVGMLDLLREMPMETKPRECVEVAWNSAHALIELINGILDFSKLEAGKL
ncbi:MAG TPA: histidine kinase dimerization/phospho-acceptor domain-containing protein, partial [Moraxellaceae bacterium]|nr:histidine kinase dimerization/phospho-acceptor domain-containing protein [Moraxellaceae bacterium]